MMAHGEVEAYRHALTSAPDRGVISFTPWSLYPWERALGSHCIGGSVGFKVGLDVFEKNKNLVPQNLSAVQTTA